MGCVPSKNSQIKVSPTALRLPLEAQEPEDRTSFLKGRVIDSIKRQDLILFEKTLQQYQLKPNELFGHAKQKQTVFHYIAANNFAEGMTFVLNYMLQTHPEQFHKIANMRDAQGNTPAMTCYMHDAIETLEVLATIEKMHPIKAQDSRITSPGTPENPSLVASSANLANANNPQHSRQNTRLSGYSSPVSPKLLPLNNLKDYSDAIMENSTPRSSVQVKSTSSAAGDDMLTSRLHQVIGELAGKNTSFIDKEFPHDLYSIIGEGSSEENIDAYKSLKWARPQDFMKCDGRALKIFDDIELNISSDSLLAGCELYSALAALTEFPQKLVKLFTSKETNKHGVYSVKFLVAGLPVEILLDDYFPCSKDSDPVFSNPSSNELWFLLIEKAFAKLYGSYKEIREIGICDAFEMMTKMPTSQVLVKKYSEDRLWEMMMDYDKKNYIVCAGNFVTAGNPRRNRIFSISRLCESDKHRVIKLANPFQDFAWEGEFSNGSVRWTKELKEQAGHYTGEQSYFYMDLKELMKQFDYLTVCHYHESWTRNSVEVEAKANKTTFFEVEADKEMEVFISVHQKLSRFLAEDTPDYDISPVEIMVAEVLEDGGLKKIACGEKDAFIGRSTIYADEKIKVKLSEGKYVIRVKVRWVDEQKHAFVLNTFSPSFLPLKKVKQTNHMNFLEKVYLTAGASSPDKYILGNECEFVSAWSGSHMWFYAVNKGKKTWDLEIVFNKLENLELSKNYQVSSNVVNFVIPPKKDAVAYVKRTTTEPYKLNWTFKQSWQEK